MVRCCGQDTEYGVDDETGKYLQQRVIIDEAIFMVSYGFFK